MEDRQGPRPRATSDAIPPGRRQNLSPFDPDLVRSPRSPGDGEANDSRQPNGESRGVNPSMEREFRSPRRAATSALAEEPNAGIQRRSTALSRRTNAQRPATILSQSRLNAMGQAGITDASAIQAAHDNYVSPGYADLNPSYEQPASSKPVWSLAKPLPRVLRPGMIPTRSEINLEQQAGIRPMENVQRVGVDIHPVDLEEGRVQPTLNPAKLSAQLKDSRAQRESNLVQGMAARRGTLTGSRIPGSRLSRVSSTLSQMDRRGRATSAASQRPPMSPTNELAEEDPADGLQSPEVTGDQPPRKSSEFPPFQEDFLEPIPEYREPATRRASAETGISQSTLQADDLADEYEDMDKIHLEVPPEYEEIDEIHNNHTAWSVFRTHHREFFAELLGCFVQLTIGFCADISATLNGRSANVNTTAWAWGFATMIGIYVSGGISGAHLNPVITVMLWFYRGFPKRKMPQYFLAQFLGAFIAAFTAYGLYYASIRNYEATTTTGSLSILDGFITSQRFSYIDAATAFFNEFLGVTFLTCAVLALGDDQNAPPGAGMNSLVIGLLITALNFSFTYQTGAALNPSRDFGPRLAMYAVGYGAELFTNPFWFYGPWAGTLCGAMTGAALYDICIFTGGESPINYPLTRTKRSWRKGKKKWGRRVARVIDGLPRRKRNGGAQRDPQKQMEEAAVPAPTVS